jgi:cell division transport system permease protein
MSLKYYLREGLAGFHRAKLMSLLSVSSITAALFLLGTFLLVTLNFHLALRGLRERFEIQAFIREGAPEAQVVVAGSAIRSIPGVKDAAFVSKEEALKRFREELGDRGGLLSAIEANPLPRSFRVSLQAEHRNPESMSAIAEKIQKLPGIEEVEYGKAWLGRLYRVGYLLVVIDVSLLVIVSLAAVMVVFNTIQLTLYARRQEVEIMRLVGATDAFIQRPFLLEGMAQGLIGSLLGGGGLYLGYRVLSAQFGMLGFFSRHQMAGLVLFGIALGGLGSWVAVRRFMNRA